APTVAGTRHLRDFNASRNAGLVPAVSDRKPKARKGPDIQRTALDYLRILRSLNPAHDVKAAKSVVVMKRPN
ncbi:MAG: hypothetical protein WA383_16285, partial [Terriglobales bacterium]